MNKAIDIRVSGIVQGVGFRPFVYRVAKEHDLSGWVHNAADGVHIHLEGPSEQIGAFEVDLIEKAPHAASISNVIFDEGTVHGHAGFEIRASQDDAEIATLVSPDIATCPECLDELFDEDNRRYHYPFINCTNCGPRFTIIEALPYDRPSTSMRPFVLCPLCKSEYDDPADRRFHAQPNACFICGPALSLWETGGRVTEASRSIDDTACTTPDALIQRVVELIVNGGIVALKGLGGYHLACDATNEEAVQHLRERKRRYDKPLAIMVATLEDARRHCHVDTMEAEVLSGSIRPIVLLERKAAPPWEDETRTPGNPVTSSLAPNVAGVLHEVGIMLPYTPVQHLLMAALDRPLVMTSGNFSEEPILTDVAEAHAVLGSVADAFLDNDRPILSRYDDSVVRVIDGEAILVRRARGYAPTPIPLPSYHTLPLGQSPTLLAVGPEQKSTFCLTRGTEGFVSQHIGDLESAETFSAWLTTLRLYEKLFALKPEVIVCDMHPEYLSTKWARAQELPLVEVQHHHAHIAAVIAEHKHMPHDRSDTHIDRVIGIACDGTGYGQDGAIWGGEVLIADLAEFERFAHLRYMPMPGGKAAVQHPARMAYGVLKTCDLKDHPGADDLLKRLGADRCLLMDQMIGKQLNSPLTSSMGRLFDAMSALIGLGDNASYDGAAAIALEATLYDRRTARPFVDLNADGAAHRYRFKIEPIFSADKGARRKIDGYLIDPTPTFKAALDDKAAGAASGRIARRFHEAVAHCMVDICNRARKNTGLGTVALSGGVFMNRYLLTRVLGLLEDEGFTTLLNRVLPANDGCIAYGQAVVAAAQIDALRSEGIVIP